MIIEFDLQIRSVKNLVWDYSKGFKYNIYFIPW